MFAERSLPGQLDLVQDVSIDKLVVAVASVPNAA